MTRTGTKYVTAGILPKQPRCDVTTTTYICQRANRAEAGKRRSHRARYPKRGGEGENRTDDHTRHNLRRKIKKKHMGQTGEQRLHILQKKRVELSPPERGKGHGSRGQKILVLIANQEGRSRVGSGIIRELVKNGRNRKRAGSE